MTCVGKLMNQYNLSELLQQFNLYLFKGTCMFIGPYVGDICVCYAVATLYATTTTKIFDFLLTFH
jgi:hypothetical protein